MKISLLILIVLILSAAGLPAQVPIKEYDHFKNDPSFKTFIHGVGTGLLLANVELKRRNSPLLYCQPVKLSLNQDTYMSILEKRVKERESQVVASTPVELLLLEGLKETFPCTLQSP